MCRSCSPIKCPDYWDETMSSSSKIPMRRADRSRLKTDAGFPARWRVIVLKEVRLFGLKHTSLRLYDPCIFASSQAGSRLKCQDGMLSFDLDVPFTDRRCRKPFRFTLKLFLKGVCSWIRMLHLLSFCLIPAILISSRNPMTSFQECGGGVGVRAEHQGG
jgi:hypothetical protein